MSIVATFEPVAPSRARRPAINSRMIVVVGIFCVLVGYPVYQVVKAQLNHGIERVAGDQFKVDLKALGYFPFDPKAGTIANIPKQFRDLDGKKVTLEGFVVPLNSAGDRVQSFQFVYNVQKCCFGGPPKVQERVFSIAKAGGVPNSGEEVSMTGTLHVKVVRPADGDEAVSVYTMDVDHVDSM